jgi:ubiquinone/menaquinone biosynthesis C-methylase UbiE
MAMAAGSELSPDVSRSAGFRDFWKSYFHFYDTLNAAVPYTAMIERLAEAMAIAPGQRVLDAGAGTGNVAAALAARGARVTGIDFCEHGLEKCRIKVPEGEFRLADLTQPLPFEDGAFEKATCSLVLQYLNLEQAGSAVRELARVIVPGGLVGLTVFAKGFNSITVYRDALSQHRKTHSLPKTVLFALRHLFNTARILYYVREINQHEKRGDYTYYDKDDLVRLLRNAGLEVVEIAPVFSSQSFLAVGRKPAGAAA